MEHTLCGEPKLHWCIEERKICELYSFYLVIQNLKALSGTSELRSTTPLKSRNKPKFRFKKVCLRPLRNGRFSKADGYFWKINRRLKAHYRPLADSRPQLSYACCLTYSRHSIAIIPKAPNCFTKKYHLCYSLKCSHVDGVSLCLSLILLRLPRYALELILI